MKKILLALIMIGLFLTGCEKNDDKIVNKHEDAWGDVIVKKMNMMGQTKYTLMIFAGGEGIVAGGSTVTTPNGDVYNFETFWAGEGMLRSMEAPVQNTYPATGEYVFRLKFNDGEEVTVKDVVENRDVDVPRITMVYDSINQTIDLSWQPINNCDLICIKMTDLNMAASKPYYKVPQLPANTTHHTIHIDGSNGWLRPVSELQDGTEYWVVVSAKTVEQGTEVSGASHDFQTNACNKVKVRYAE